MNELLLKLIDHIASMKPEVRKYKLHESKGSYRYKDSDFDRGYWEAIDDVISYLDKYTIHE